MVSKDKFNRVWIILYFLMVLMVSLTSFYSPFVGNNYTLFIFLNSFILWATSFYLIGFKAIRLWLHRSWRAAEKRAEIRKEVEEELKRRGY